MILKLFSSSLLLYDLVVHSFYMIYMLIFYLMQMASQRVPIPVQRPNGTTPAGTTPSTSAVTFFFCCMIASSRYMLCVVSGLHLHSDSTFKQAMPHSSQTVVVENPMSVDETGKLVASLSLPLPSLSSSISYLVTLATSNFMVCLGISGDKCCGWGYHREEITIH